MTITPVVALMDGEVGLLEHLVLTVVPVFHK